MAELLVEGHETGVVSRMLGVTPGAVSQSRTWLEASWRAFQGEAEETGGRGSAGPRNRSPIRGWGAGGRERSAGIPRR